ncbi:MAG: DUF2235 domain-containing protein [bacterium]|nr:DUF2235 domain-containing protein [bacterium]
MHKRLIVCCDGTWNKPEKSGKEQPTNVLKLVRAILPSDSEGINQIVYYDQGVGTGNILDRVVGGATGMGISTNILEAYGFLANNYRDGDEIYLFGFSRGSYTVRSLGQLIATAGLLKKGDLHKMPLVYKFYKKKPSKRQKLNCYDEVTELIKNKNTDVRIKMIGVWDTVGALGAPTPLLGWISRKLWVGFHDTGLSDVQFAYHALAIDERRKPFAPSIWTSHEEVEELKQVWFCGVHSNIGGGYSDTGLADIAFLWMVKMAKKRDLEFDPQYLTEKVTPNHKGRLVNSYKGMYKLLGMKYLRPLGHIHLDVEEDREGVCEFIHESAVKRYKEQLETHNPKHFEHGIKNLKVEPE